MKIKEATIKQFRHKPNFWWKLLWNILGKEVPTFFEYKIVFTDQDDAEEFIAYTRLAGGHYDFDKTTNFQYGELPEFGYPIEFGTPCWCDYMGWYLNTNGYKCVAVSESGAFKIYRKD